jgi:ech hydrogenase subunit F
MFRMTPTIMRNFFSKRATRRYPQVVRPPFANSRGAIQNDIATCTFCGICSVKCPSQCLSVDKKSATWQWDFFGCIYCGICVDSCKSGSLRQEPTYPQASTKRERMLLAGVVAPREAKKAAAQTVDT